MKIDASYFPEIKTDLDGLEKILINRMFEESKAYHGWRTQFVEIYDESSMEIRLFLLFSLVYFIGWKTFFNVIDGYDFFYKSSKDLDDLVNRIHQMNDKFSLPFFNELINVFARDEKSKYKQLMDKIFPTAKTPLDTYFDELVKTLISPVIRHKSGEFYTPSFLVKKMIDKAYIFGETVVDPSCGTGNFLLEIIKKVIHSDKSQNSKFEAISNIHGFDINPVSLILARVNLLEASGNYHVDLKDNLKIVDSLFFEKDEFKQKFELVIGNPPWYTLRDIYSPQYQEKVKKLAEKLDIKPLPKNILNIEIASVFFYKTKETLMRENSKIFFVLPRGVLTGSHASRFRNFDGFRNILIWNFDDSVMKTFNIDFICLYGEKDSKLSDPLKLRKVEVPEITWKFKKEKTKSLYSDDMRLIVSKKDFLLPYSKFIKNSRAYTQKFISKDKIKHLIPSGESAYKKLFHKGADLNPRNLIFVKVKNVDNENAIINPDERIFKRAKAPWNEIIFTEQIVNKRYIFNAIKSTELVSFNLFSHYSVFLPLNKNNLEFDFEALDQNSRRFYNLINGYYLNHKKKSTKMTSLLENLNHWQKLITERQLSGIKVVYNNSGSILTSAVITDNYLVTGDLSFFDTNDINEAYYLSAILNSKVMNEQIRIKKSSRHIFKIPLGIPIPPYNKKDKIHLDLANLGKIGHQKAKKIVESTLNKNPRTSKFKLQKILEKKLKSIFTEIDEKLYLLFDLKNNLEILH
jgi:hypothetical protein